LTISPGVVAAIHVAGVRKETVRHGCYLRESEAD